MPSEVVNLPVNEIEDAAGIPESGGLPYAPEGDLIHEILERSHMFTRRLAEQVDDGLHPEDIKAWLDDIEAILNERGYRFKRFFDAQRRWIDEHG